jgi:hypothetical protein
MHQTIAWLFAALLLTSLSLAEGPVTKTIDTVPPLAWGKSGESTFCGALNAAGKAMNFKTDYATLLGDTSLAFRTRWWRKDEGAGWCPSSPVGEMTPWTHRVESTIGYKISFNVDFDAKADFNQYAPRVKQEIDAGRPVLAYSDQFDMAVIYGYADEGKRFYFRDYFNGDKPLVLELAKTKGLLAFFDKPVPVASPKDRAATAIKNAVADWKLPKDATNNPKGGGGYYFGDAAYAKWIADLSNDQLTDAERKELFHPSWWTFCVLADARANAITYLHQAAPLFEGESQAAIRRAADLYAQSVQVCGQAFQKKDAFLGAWSGKKIDDWTADVRQREVELLEKVRKSDNAAIAELERVR